MKFFFIPQNVKHKSLFYELLETNYSIKTEEFLLDKIIAKELRSPRCRNPLNIVEYILTH